MRWGQIETMHAVERRSDVLSAWDRLVIFAFLSPQEMNAARLRQEVIDCYTLDELGMAAPGVVAFGGEDRSRLVRAHHRHLGGMDRAVTAEVAANTTATKERVLIDCRVVAEMKDSSYGWRSVEQRAQAAESRCKEFNDFIRDHRSQDDIRLEVERIFEDRCSNCGTAWEPISDGNRPICANCEMEVGS